MAALSLGQIKTTFAAMLSADPTLGTSTLTKPDYQAAITAADTWCTNNAATFVATLPEPFRSTSSAAQKALLLAYVALRRWTG